jgi:hypothetical protein
MSCGVDPDVPVRSIRVVLGFGGNLLLFPPQAAPPLDPRTDSTPAKPIESVVRDRLPRGDGLLAQARLRFISGSIS